MNDFIRRFFTRYQHYSTPQESVMIGIKGLITITALLFLNKIFGIPLLIAPFGASCILIYTTPKDEYAQPLNVLGGYFITGLISLIMLDFFPHAFWVVGLVLGVSITTTALLRLTHPPAGAVPVVVYFSAQTVDYWFLLSPIMCGSATLVLLALILHRIPPSADYPRR